MPTDNTTYKITATGGIMHNAYTSVTRSSQSHKRLTNNSQPVSLVNPSHFLTKAIGNDYDSASTVTKKKRKACTTGCKGSYSLGQLHHHDHYLNTPVEPMHLFKNIVEHIVRLLSGAADFYKVRQEE